jgi:hypothetical protein
MKATKLLHLYFWLNSLSQNLTLEALTVNPT